MSHSTHRDLPKRKENVYLHNDLYTNVHITFIKNWKQAKCSSTSKWINKLWGTHTIEYSSAIRMDELTRHITTWMNLKVIMWS